MVKKRLIFCLAAAGSLLFSGDDFDADYGDYFGSVEEPEMVDQEGLIDLEAGSRDFILETKRIEIPGYPDAFNPSMTRWKGSLILSFRIYNAAHNAAPRIGLVRLDERFAVAGEPQILEFRHQDPQSGNKRQDPRLLTVGDRLYIVYNNVTEGTREMRRMLFAEVKEEGERFYVDEAERIHSFERESSWRSEKNWVPFDLEGRLYFGYSLTPHRILQPVIGTGTCSTAAITDRFFDWNFGVLRGGTPAIKISEDHYLSFFHSSVNMASLHSKGRVVQHYFMGAYLFSAHPPFPILKMSKEPIVGKDFYHGAEYQTWKPLCVVFPGGIVADEQYVWVAYGRQDHEIWIAKFDKEKLLESLQ